MSGSEFDLLVIGEGLAGISAAAVAAGRGMRVALAATGPGNFVLGTANLDVEGINSAELAPFARSPEMLDEAIAFFCNLSAHARCSYEGAAHQQRLLPTVMGTFQKASLAPRTIWKGDPRSLAKVVIVGIDCFSLFDADFVAERLSASAKSIGCNTLYRSATVQLPDEHPHPLTAIEIATRWDRSPAYQGVFVEELKHTVQDAELVVLPGVLGVKSDDDDFSQLEEEIGCSICELPTVPPSVPGLRLLQRFETHLADIGVEVCSGFSVQELSFQGNRCTGAYLNVPCRLRHIKADCVVLATGRFSNLDALDSSSGFSRRVPAVDDELRAINHDGSTVADNLFVCGSALGASEPLHRNAIAVLTGYRAGMIASRTGVAYAAR